MCQSGHHGINRCDLAFDCDIVVAENTACLNPVARQYGFDTLLDGNR